MAAAPRPAKKAKAVPPVKSAVSEDDEFADRMHWALKTLKDELESLPLPVGLAGLQPLDTTSYRTAMQNDKECECVGPVTDFDPFTFVHASARPLMGDLASI